MLRTNAPNTVTIEDVGAVEGPLDTPLPAVDWEMTLGEAAKWGSRG